MKNILSNLPKTTTRKNKRVGRGMGSGKGFHTTGRGQKGQKSRSSVSIWFEGGQLPLSKRLPFLRGKDRFKSQQSVTVINLSQLSSFKSGQTVDKKALADQGIISVKEAAGRVKLLAKGEIKTALKLKGIQASQSAQEKITQAGGSID